MTNPTLLDRPTEPPMTGEMKTMKAIVQDEYGTAPEDVLRLAEIARPAIGDDEILVRVHAASVDRGTWHIMTGLPYAIRVAGFGLRRPKATNPGRSLAGTVESVGKDVTRVRAGRRGLRHLRRLLRRVRLRPSGPARPQAGEPLLRAGGRSPRLWARPRCRPCVTSAQVQPGQKVLIIGASGGVGTFAVQIAKAFGARGDRRVQHRQGRRGPIHRRRPRHRLHARGLRRRRAPLRRDPRHRRQPPALTPPSSPHPSREAGDRRRRDRRTLARRCRPPTPSAPAVPAGKPEAGHRR